MFNIIKKEIEWNGKTLSFETGRIARQASGSVLVKYGNTTILAAVTVAQKPVEGADFLPLTVHYIEKSYAAGKIPGGFFKREAKPSEVATLTSRLIDRPIRPLFPSDFHHDVNVICTLLSYDASSTPDVVALIAASAALSISEAPFAETIAAARVGIIDNEMVLNPSKEELLKSDLDLIIAGTESSVLMVESEAKQLSEEKMLEAVNYAHKSFQPVIKVINELRDEVGKENMSYESSDNSSLLKDIKDFAGDKIVAAYKIQDKQERAQSLNALYQDISDKYLDEDQGVVANRLKKVFKQLSQDVVRGDVLKNKTRIDGRKTDEVRQIEVEVGVLPQVHGCALFTRGETQSLAVATLGGPKDRQMIENLDPGMIEESFMLHYNFPPYSVGEVGQLRAPGRREIGHGKLAFRAINPVFPTQEEFSYTTRIVSEITESNGSSSMATVCAASLALMDAGVPIKSPVSGIAMGLIKEGDDYVVLSDIMGDEDHLGDMDFKVAGTKDGITSLQMDIKINGITSDVMQEALTQAKIGRIHILDKMVAVMSEPRTDLNPNAPKVEVLNVDPKKVREIIGSRGRVIKEICSVSGAVVDVDDSGQVKISSNSSDCIAKALAMVNDIIFEPEIGDIYEGPVVKVIDAGAFVNISNNRDGFVHVSELAEYRVDFVEDVINEGDIVKVKVIGFDKKGRPKLSFRCVDQATGEDISDQLSSQPQLVDERDSGGRDRRDRKERSGGSDRRSSNNNDDDNKGPKKRRGFFS